MLRKKRSIGQNDVHIGASDINIIFDIMHKLVPIKMQPADKHRVFADFMPIGIRAVMDTIFVWKAATISTVHI